MSKQNCWEFEKCGRQPGGERTDLGICPAAVEKKLSGAHGGTNGGRACWVVAGTLCSGEIQGTFAKKYKNCEQCAFYQQVQKEEGPSYKLAIALLQKMRS